MLFDGLRSAKIMNEKEVYIIKTCDNGEPCLDVLVLEQQDDAGAAGLKVTLDKAIAKGNFCFDCLSREIGLGSLGFIVWRKMKLTSIWTISKNWSFMLHLRTIPGWIRMQRSYCCWCIICSGMPISSGDCLNLFKLLR